MADGKIMYHAEWYNHQYTQPCATALKQMASSSISFSSLSVCLCHQVITWWLQTASLITVSRLCPARCLQSTTVSWPQTRGEPDYGLSNTLSAPALKIRLRLQTLMITVGKSDRYSST